MGLKEFLLALLVVTVSLTGQGLAKVTLNQARIATTGNPDVASVVHFVILSPLFWVALCVIGLGAVIFFTLLYTTDISRALPVMGGISYIMLFAFAHFYLGEVISVRQCFGLCLLFAGTYLSAA